MENAARKRKILNKHILFIFLPLVAQALSACGVVVKGIESSVVASGDGTSSGGTGGGGGAGGAGGSPGVLTTVTPFTTYVPPGNPADSRLMALRSGVGISGADWGLGDDGTLLGQFHFDTGTDTMVYERSSRTACTGLAAPNCNPAWSLGGDPGQYVYADNDYFPDSDKLEFEIGKLKQISVRIKNTALTNFLWSECGIDLGFGELSGQADATLTRRNLSIHNRSSSNKDQITFSYNVNEDSMAIQAKLNEATTTLSPNPWRTARWDAVGVVSNPGDFHNGEYVEFDLVLDFDWDTEVVTYNIVPVGTNKGGVTVGATVSKAWDLNAPIDTIDDFNRVRQGIDFAGLNTDLGGFTKADFKALPAIIGFHVAGGSTSCTYSNLSVQYYAP